MWSRWSCFFSLQRCNREDCDAASATSHGGISRCDCYVEIHEKDGVVALEGPESYFVFVAYNNLRGDSSVCAGLRDTSHNLLETVTDEFLEVHRLRWGIGQILALILKCFNGLGFDRQKWPFRPEDSE